MMDLARARRSLSLAAFLLALAAVGSRLQALQPPQFVPPPAPGGVTAAELATPVIHDLPNPAASAHSVSLVDLGDGRLGAAWFAGSKEGASDVSIVFSSFNGRQWTPPAPIVSNEKVEADEKRVNRKIGNPVLWRESPQRLHLWFVTVSYGGWAGSSLNHQISHDLGEHWESAEKLVTSPFLNISTLLRSPPLQLTDGGFALPVYHEFIAKHPEWLRLDASGRVVDKQALGGARRQIQPTAVALDAEHGLLLTRDAGSGQHAVHLSRTADGGQSWSPLTGLDLPNPDASVAMTRLHDGRLLLAYNPINGGRHQLALALSTDGARWTPIHLLESGQGEDEFSYPAVLQMPDGRIHVAYTWQRQHIRQQIFTPGLLDRLTAKAEKAP
jgi:predicted neuraminidase